MPPTPPLHPSVPPVRVAAVDVGSNAMRFLAAEVDAGGALAALEEARVPVRIGHSAFATGAVDAASMAAAVAGLASFRGRMDELGISHYRAVATSAVRESRNGAELVARAWTEAGIRLEPISGTEEARLVWEAARGRVGAGEARWLLVDVGGGSVEISLAEEGALRSTESLPLGAVRLLEELGADASPEDVRRVLAPRLRLPRGAEGVIGTGGNIEALATLAGGRGPGGALRRLPLDALRAAVERLAALSPAERVSRLGLREDRADVILPGAVVYERIAELAGAAEIVVPFVGVKEGLALDVAAQLRRGGRARDVRADAGSANDEHPPNSSPMENPIAQTQDPATPVQQRIAEAYQLLAALYESIGAADPENAAVAQQHVTNATRELAAVQRLFERRGHGA